MEESEEQLHWKIRKEIDRHSFKQDAIYRKRITELLIMRIYSENYSEGSRRCAEVTGRDIFEMPLIDIERVGIGYGIDGMEFSALRRFLRSDFHREQCENFIQKWESGEYHRNMAKILPKGVTPQNPIVLRR